MHFRKKNSTLPCTPRAGVAEVVEINQHVRTVEISENSTDIQVT